MWNHKDILSKARRFALKACMRIVHVPGETEVCASKWDNHNAIARGFTGMKENYHPVTFRQIYNVDSQTNKAETTQNL